MTQSMTRTGALVGYTPDVEACNADGTRALIALRDNAKYDDAYSATARSTCGLVRSVVCSDRRLDPNLPSRDVDMIGSRTDLVEAMGHVRTGGMRMNDNLVTTIAAGVATFAIPARLVMTKFKYVAIDFEFLGAPLSFPATTVAFDLSGGANNAIYEDGNSAGRVVSINLDPRHLGKHILVLMTAPDGSDADLPGVPRPVTTTPTHITLDMGWTLNNIPAGITGINAQIATSNSDAMARLCDAYGVGY